MHKRVAAVAADMEVVVAEVTWRACTEATLAMDDVISLAATTALLVRITGHTPVTAEWWVDFGSCRPAAFAIHDPRI
jgi:hypothetical protein